MDISKFTKAQIQEEYSKMEATAKQNLETAQSAVGVANYLYSSTLSIDNKILASLKGDPKKSIMWVIANWRVLVDIVQYVIDVVKEVKAKIEEINKQNNPPAPNVPPGAKLVNMNEA